MSYACGRRDDVTVSYILVQSSKESEEQHVPVHTTTSYGQELRESEVLHHHADVILRECSTSCCARYTAPVLTHCLQFIGCKTRRARKVCHKVFWLLAQRVKEQSNAQRCVLKLDRREFERVVFSCLGDHPRHVPGHVKMSHFRIACRVAERKLGLIVLLCGTSGTGKSTLASLVASRLGISHVMSTDAIRNILRGFDEEKKQECLWSSTYEHERDLVEENYMNQREAILQHVESVVAAFGSRCESIVIEGVHLSGAFAVEMAEKYRNATVVPFLVHISNREKHLERFAVRAKAMTLRPENNRYVQHLESIRRIQHILQKEAVMHGIPQVDNTNVDRSLDVIHTTILGMLSNGSSLLDVFESTVMSTWKSSVAMEQIYNQRTIPLGASPTATSFTSTFSEGGCSRMMGDSDHDSLKHESQGEDDDEDIVHGSIKALSEITKSDV